MAGIGPHLLSRLRFNPSGTVLTDRWGALLKFTRFLDDAAEQVFLDELMKTEEVKEGISSFYEKRKPDWKNQ